MTQQHQPCPICGGRGEHVPPCSEVAVIQTYRALPETVCAAIRGCVDGFGTWWRDDELDGIHIKTTGGTVFVREMDASDYVTAWRRSGLWRLQGFDTPTTPTGDQS